MKIQELEEGASVRSFRFLSSDLFKDDEIWM